MSKEERHLQTKIRMFEDILLRTKNPSQPEFRTNPTRVRSAVVARTATVAHTSEISRRNFFFCCISQPAP